MTTETTERALIAELKRIHDLQEVHRQLGKDLDERKKPYRDWLAAHGGEALRDGEHDIVARLQARSGGRVYADVLEMQAKVPDLVAKLLTLGALQIDDKRLRDLLQRGVLTKGEMASWCHEINGTPALLIERTKED